MPTAVWPTLGLAAAVEDSPSPSASPKTGANSLASEIVTVTVLVAVLAGVAPSVAHDDHLLPAAAVGGGGLVVRDAVGLARRVVSPEISLRVGAAGSSCLFRRWRHAASASLAAPGMAFCVFSAMVTEVADENTGLSSFASIC